ncbi:hypothetical protein PRZ48_011664 [Zasmidium cellare]|uniref:Uncharacterized protein n=1 Tax=Zasmidium cellare TaxID=395010 RepID=A0ABR0E729_ZASCE|nr:hypothetical protein PRZ48_011664 [Zasmidium cellare]
MPFEFSGAPPALLNSNSAFSSFASPSEATSTPPTNASKSFPGTQPPFQFGGASSFGAARSFGTASPFASTVKPSTSNFGSTPSFGTASPFGSPTTPTFGSTSTWPSPLPQLQCKALTSVASPLCLNHTTLSPANEPPPNNPLTRALNRASTGRLAIFGRREIAADGILKGIFTDDKHDIPALLTALHEVESSNPTVANFIRTLFDEFIRAQMPEDEQPTEETSPTPGNEATQETPANNDQSSDEDRPMAPRNHWRVRRFAKRLTDVLFDEGYIWYEEGARVLADYIIDLSYEDTHRIMVDKVVELLGRQANDVAIDDVVTWARRSLQEVDDEYHFFRDDEEDQASGQADVDESKAKKSSATKGTSGAATTNPTKTAGRPIAESGKEPFRFLDLPAEMRNNVYRELMVPGHISFDYCSYSHGHDPRDRATVIRQTTCKTQILATCRQIYDEAKDILFENCVCVTGGTLEGMYPVIPQSLLPDRILSKLTSMTISMVHTKSARSVRKDIQKLNWRQFQQMTGLKNLRISIIEREDQAGDPTDKKFMIEQIVERVPKDCEIAFESSAGFEDDFAQSIIEQLDAEKKRHPEVRFGDAYEVDGELLGTLAEEFMGRQGCKSGSKRDYRFPERSFKLNPLVPATEVNPSIVLGGGQ